MSDLFALAMPWWEFILRAVIVYVVVLVMVRLAGKRTLGQFTPFDMLLLVLLGNAVQNALLGPDTSLGGGLLLALTLISLNYFVGWITTRSPAVERVIEGEPVVLARHGHVLQKVLQRELVSKADFSKAMRDAGCDDVGVRMSPRDKTVFEHAGMEQHTAHPCRQTSLENPEPRAFRSRFAIKRNDCRSKRRQSRAEP